jgi:hypothetical protein
MSSGGGWGAVRAVAAQPAAEVAEELVQLLRTARAGCRHRRLISLAGQCVDFLADQREGAQIADTILGPYCEVVATPEEATPTTAPVWTVTSVYLAELADRMRSWERRCVAAGVAPQVVRRWPGDFPAARFDVAPGHTMVLHRRPFLGVTVFLPEKRELHYVRADSDFDVSNTEHALKYPLRTTLRQAGLSQVHAAGCVYQDRGLLIMGEKASGKSTMLVQLMAAGGHQVSNDLSFVDARAAGPEMIAFPHITRLGLGTVDDCAVLRSGLAGQERTGDYLRSPVFNGGKEEFYYPVLERIWGRPPLRRRAPLDLILFPRFEVGRARARPRRLAPAERDERVRRSLVTDPPLPDWLPFLPAAELRRLAAAAADALLRWQPPAWEVRFGPSGSDPAGVVADIIRSEK